MKHPLNLTIKITFFALWFIAATFFLLIFLSSFVFKYNHTQDFISFIESKRHNWEQKIQDNIEYIPYGEELDEIELNGFWYNLPDTETLIDLDDSFISDDNWEWLEAEFIFGESIIEQEELDEKYLEFYPAEDYISVESNKIIWYGFFTNIKIDTSFLLNLKRWEYIQKEITGDWYIFYNNLESNKIFVTPSYDFEIVWSLLYITFWILLLLLIPLFFFSRQIIIIYFKPIAESNQRLQQYNHNLAHEIKTPISSILLSLDLLAHQNPWEDIGYLKDELKGINKIVESLLSVSEKATTQLSQHNIWHLIIKHIQTYPKDIQSSISVETNDSFFIKTDPELFTRILNNLIKNALKYSNDKALIISIDKSSICFKNNIIKDIPKEELNKLTDFFYRGPVIDNTPGHGLGLSIVKTISDDLNYKISLESQNNTFSLTITFK